MNYMKKNRKNVVKPLCNEVFFWEHVKKLFAFIMFNNLIICLIKSQRGGGIKI